MVRVPTSRGAGFFARGVKFKKRHCQQKQILVVMLQFEILVDMIEFQSAQDRPVSREKFYFANLLSWLDQFFGQCQLFLINLEFKTLILRCDAS